MTADSIAITPSESQNITREKLKKFLPKGSSVQVTDEILKTIMDMEKSTGLPQNLLEEDLMSYMHLIGKVGGVGLNDLVNAIKYCNLKRNRTNKEAWAIVFPVKYDELTSAGKPVDNFVSMYNNSKLVVAIDKEMLVPAYIQYSAYHHAAIQAQYKLMMGTDANGNEASAMVQHLAAKELALLTKMPEDKSIELKVGLSDAALASQQEMNQTLSQLVANQARMFASGMKPADIQKVHTVAVIEEAIQWDEDELDDNDRQVMRN
jgi:hypothetical protein